MLNMNKNQSGKGPLSGSEESQSEGETTTKANNFEGPKVVKKKQFWRPINENKKKKKKQNRKAHD